jgi:hypothetical protein
VPCRVLAHASMPSMQLAHLQAAPGANTHATWCLDTLRSGAYDDGKSDWVSVSYSGEVQIWKDPVDTGAVLTSVGLHVNFGGNVCFNAWCVPGS